MTALDTLRKTAKRWLTALRSGDADAHGDRREMVRLLSRYSRDLWTLCFNGEVARVQEILADDPSLAAAVDPSGGTPLWCCRTTSARQ